MQALLDSIKPTHADHALAMSLDADRLPAHIAIIMDGNGRWASKRHLPRVAGHRAGVDSVLRPEFYLNNSGSNQFRDGNFGPDIGLGIRYRF